MIARTLVNLAQLHFEYGLIGLDEYVGSQAVALWLEGSGQVVSDPRVAGEDGVFEEQNPEEIVALEATGTLQRSAMALDQDDDSKLDFLWNGWVFTRQDADPYPSTPHGHLHNPNRKWPKLNPYIGRVFKAKHSENVKLRLSKKQMTLLWKNQDFREFCRGHVTWYLEAHPDHDFRVPNPFRFPRPWRK